MTNPRSVSVLFVFVDAALGDEMFRNLRALFHSFDSLAYPLPSFWALVVCRGATTSPVVRIATIQDGFELMTKLTKHAYDTFAARARTLATQASTEAARIIHLEIARDYEAKAASLAVVCSYATGAHVSCPSDPDADCSAFQPMSAGSNIGTGIGSAPEGHVGDGITTLALASPGASKLAIVLNTTVVIIFTIIFAGGFSMSGEAFSSAIYAILRQPTAKPLGAPAVKRENLKKGEAYGTASGDVLVFQKRLGR
jgi:hypothetical protein